LIVKLRIYLMTVSCFCLLNISADNGFGFQRQSAEAKNLRRLFAQTVGQDFEIVKDEMKTRPRDSVSDYWLVHVKPRRSGYYTLKYTYKFVGSPNNYPEEGETIIRIRVGEKRCYRRNLPESGIANFCLGDTIIIPITTTNMRNHAFTFERREQETESLEKAQKESRAYQKITPVQSLNNPLAANLKLLGTQRTDRPHRNCCPVTYDFYVYFEAIKPGKFNLGLSPAGDGKTPESLTAMKEGGTPIIIVNSETPIIGLISSEETTHYGDKKRFSAHGGNSFPTTLLILQPGDIFALKYSGATIDYGLGSKSTKNQEIPDIKPAIYKIPFAIDKDWSFNDWLPNYLAKGK
jgi:hypothetical protein